MLITVRHFAVWISHVLDGDGAQTASLWRLERNAAPRGCRIEPSQGTTPTANP